MLYISVLSVQLHLPVKTYKDSALKFINHARKQRVREIDQSLGHTGLFVLHYHPLLLPWIPQPANETCTQSTHTYLNTVHEEQMEQKQELTWMGKTEKNCGHCESMNTKSNVSSYLSQHILSAQYVTWLGQSLQPPLAILLLTVGCQEKHRNKMDTLQTGWLEERSGEAEESSEI